MKGLVYKDLQTIKGYKNSVLILLLVFIGVSFVNDGYLNMLMFMIPFMVIMMSINTFSYDEYTLWDTYALTMSLNRKDIVRGKYVLAFILIAIGVVLGALIPLLIGAVSGNPSNLEDILFSLGTILFGIGLVVALTIPFIYKFGADKARIYMLVYVALLALGVVGIDYLLNNTFDISIALATLYNIINGYGIIVAIVALGGAFVLSYKISCNIYEKKEL